jgi:hypothetical protein
MYELVLLHVRNKILIEIILLVKILVVIIMCTIFVDILEQ